MTYQRDIDQQVQSLEDSVTGLDIAFKDLKVLSHNTIILRSPDHPDDFISGFERNINAEWWDYPVRGRFIVDSDLDTLITTDAVMQSYGVLIQLSYDILGNKGSWYPGDDDGMFFDRRYGDVAIHSIGRKQGVHFLKLPRGEYTLQVRYRLIPDIMYVGLCGVSNVSIGVRSL